MKNNIMMMAVGAALAISSAQGTARAADTEISAEVLLAAPAPRGVSVGSLTAAGSGCPHPGLVSYELVDNGDALEIEMGELTALMASPRPAPSRSCTLRVVLNLPAGYSYALSDITHRGSALLPPGSRGMLLTRYWFPGSRTASASTQLVGTGMDGSARPFEETKEFDAPVWSACGGGNSPMSVAITAAISGARGAAAVLNAGAPGNPITLGLTFRRCR